MWQQYKNSKCVFYILRIKHQLLETSSMTIIQFILQSLITMTTRCFEIVIINLQL